MIASLLLNREVDELLETALPLVLYEKDQYSDSFTEFIEAIYEDFDFDRAQTLIKQMTDDASNDLLLKNFSTQIQLQATLLVHEVKCQVYKSVNVSSLSTLSGVT